MTLLAFASLPTPPSSIAARPVRGHSHTITMMMDAMVPLLRSARIALPPDGPPFLHFVHDTLVVQAPLPYPDRTPHGPVCRDCPNIVFALTDDQDLTLGGWTPMRQTQQAIQAKGATLTEWRIHTPICSPSARVEWKRPLVRSVRSARQHSILAIGSSPKLWIRSQSWTRLLCSCTTSEGGLLCPQTRPNQLWGPPQLAVE